MGELVFTPKHNRKNAVSFAEEKKKMEQEKRTQRNRIKSSLRTLWLRSVERATAMKNAKYCCENCGVKQSKAKGKEQKVEVHHKEGVGNWDKIIDVIRQELLCSPENLKVLCPTCHKEEHELD